MSGLSTTLRLHLRIYHLQESQEVPAGRLLQKASLYGGVVVGYGLQGFGSLDLRRHPPATQDQHQRAHRSG